MDNIKDTVMGIISDYTPSDNITLESTLDWDLDIYPFDYTNILMDLEEEFDISIRNEDIPCNSTVGEIIDFIKSRVTE